MSTKRHFYAVQVKYGDGFMRGGITGELLDTILAFKSVAELTDTRAEGHHYRTFDLVRVSRRFVEKELGRDFYITKAKYAARWRDTGFEDFEE